LIEELEDIDADGDRLATIKRFRFSRELRHFLNSDLAIGPVRNQLADVIEQFVSTLELNHPLVGSSAGRNLLRIVYRRRVKLGISSGAIDKLCCLQPVADAIISDAVMYRNEERDLELLKRAFAVASLEKKILSMAELEERVLPSLVERAVILRIALLRPGSSIGQRMAKSLDRLFFHATSPKKDPETRRALLVGVLEKFDDLKDALPGLMRKLECALCEARSELSEFPFAN